MAGESEDSKAISEEESKAFWNTWYDANKDDFAYSGAEKISIFFLDTRFAKYWGNLIRLDFGISHLDKRPVLEKVFSKLKYSLSLAVTSVFLAYIISLPLGIWSAVNENSTSDRVVTLILFMLYSLPSFFVGVVLLNFFTIGSPLQIFPTAGFESIDTSNMTTLEHIKDVIWHIFLPVLCMTYGALAALSRRC